jgi:hypothetical protein
MGQFDSPFRPRFNGASALRPEGRRRAPQFPLGRRGSTRERAGVKCSLCQDCGWVCENHPDQPWEGKDACTCGGAGAPCPRCNVPEKGKTARLPENFPTEFDKKGWRHQQPGLERPVRRSYPAAARSPASYPRGCWHLHHKTAEGRASGGGVAGCDGSLDHTAARRCLGASVSCER